jgi:hypothetical protein
MGETTPTNCRINRESVPYCQVAFVRNFHRPGGMIQNGNNLELPDA